jgi:hypothetical protein
VQILCHNLSPLVNWVETKALDKLGRNASDDDLSNFLESYPKNWISQIVRGKGHAVERCPMLAGSTQ